jgi:AraC-like DNA-binding protein
LRGGESERRQPPYLKAGSETIGLNNEIPWRRALAEPLDPLSALLDRFPLRAEVFFSGAVCGSYDFDQAGKPAHFHCVKTGRVLLTEAGSSSHGVDGPAVIFMPRAGTHGLLADPGTEILCATVRFGAGSALLDALPSVVIVPVSRAPGLASLCELMFDEVSTANAGRFVALNRLCELAVINVLRDCLGRSLVNGGVLSGILDARLAKPLLAIHKQPSGQWSLDELAAMAGMSRARFALRFKAVVGITPGTHIAACRVAEAQRLVLSGLELKQVAERVGYASASAMSRSFVRVVGMTPARWLVTVVADPR